MLMFKIRVKCTKENAKLDIVQEFNCTISSFAFSFVHFTLILNISIGNVRSLLYNQPRAVKSTLESIGTRNRMIHVGCDEVKVTSDCTAKIGHFRGSTAGGKHCWWLVLSSIVLYPALHFPLYILLLFKENAKLDIVQLNSEQATSSVYRQQ
jgi:hypothetical protein